MTTIVERDIHHDSGSDNGSSATAMLVGVVAIVVIVGFVLFALRAFPFNGSVPASRSTPIDVNVDTNLPTNPGTSGQ